MAPTLPPQAIILLAPPSNFPAKISEDATTSSAQASSHLQSSENTNDHYESALALMQVLQTIELLTEQLLTEWLLSQAAILLTSSSDTPVEIIQNIATPSAQAGSHLQTLKQPNDYYESALALMQFL